VAAVVVAIIFASLRPAEMRVAPPWIVPGVEVILLAALIVNDPGRIDRRSAMLRLVSIGIVGLLVIDTLLGTGRLIAVLIEGGKTTNSAEALLAAGALAWASNVIAFALLYWLLDAGGAAARAHRMPRNLDLAFPTAVPGDRPSRLAAQIHRLPLPRSDRVHRFQPHRRDAARAPGEGLHGCAVDDLPVRDRPRDRPRGQCIHLRSARERQLRDQADRQNEDDS
jgi:hypothetical protein